MNNHPFLAFLEGAVQHAQSSQGPVVSTLRTIVNSPVVTALVAVSPSPIDVLLLTLARALLPPLPPAPAVVPTSG